MKDVTFGAAREIAGGKAGMDDIVRVERYSLFHPIRGSHFLIPMYQFWLHIYIYRIFVLLHIII